MSSVHAVTQDLVFTLKVASFYPIPTDKLVKEFSATLKDARANARLMAAAPDLLAALYAMMDNCYDPDRSDEIVQAFDAARDAIAKAEGFK